MVVEVEVVVEVVVEVEAKLAEVDEGSEMGSIIFFVVGLFLRFGEEEDMVVFSRFVVCPCCCFVCVMSHTMGNRLAGLRVLVLPCWPDLK